MNALTSPSGGLIFILLGMLVVSGWLIFRAFRRLGRRSRSSSRPTRPGERASLTRPQRDAAADVARCEVEMVETARHLKGEIDTKLVVLERLIRDADESSARLERAVAEAQRQGVDVASRSAASR